MSTAPVIPVSFGLDRSVALLRHGYRFWERERRRQGAEIVRARLLHERATAIRGAAAAEFFYEQPGTSRASALPTALVGPLFGTGPVHMLDAGPHAHRKSLFTDVLDAQACLDVTERLGRLWDARVPTWSTVDLFDEVAAMLFEAGCDWLGIPFDQAEVPERARDMLAMVDGFGAPTGRNVQARRARRRTDVWMSGLVERSRASIYGGTPLDRVARHLDPDGEPLPVHTAAVEAINLLRPLVAVTWLVSGLFRAYGDQPELGADVLAGRVSPLHVADEVRRTQPFVPFLATRATEDLTWGGESIPSGTLIVLDVWGTNHDPATWERPDAFDPRRYERTGVTPYNLVPQGGGLVRTGHRCPGEDLTLAVLMTLVPRVAAFAWRLQDPRPDLRRMPPAPRLRVTRLE